MLKFVTIVFKRLNLHLADHVSFPSHMTTFGDLLVPEFDGMAVCCVVEEDASLNIGQLHLMRGRRREENKATEGYIKYQCCVNLCVFACV